MFFYPVTNLNRDVPIQGHGGPHTFGGTASSVFVVSIDGKLSTIRAVTGRNGIHGALLEKI